MPTYRVEAIRQIRHYAIIDAETPEEAEDKYESCDWGYDNEEDTFQYDILSVDEEEE